MKTQNFSLIRSLRPVFALSLLVFSVLGFSTYVNAADANAKKSVPTKTITAKTESQIHINTASAEIITEALKGIGPKKAQAIVEWRKQNGKFTKLEQLMEIKGIGEKTLAANKSRIKL